MALKGSRKIITYAVVLAMAAVMVWFGKIDGAQWISMVEWTFGPLAVSLSAEHFGTEAPSK